MKRSKNKENPTPAQDAAAATQAAPPSEPAAPEAVSPAAPTAPEPAPPAEPAAPEASAPGAAPLVRNKYADKMNARKKLPKQAKIAIAAAVAALLGGGGWFAMSKMDNSAPVSQDTAFSELGFLETYVEGYGQTSAKRREELGKDIKGTVSEVLASPGDTVTEGDVLLIIDPSDTRKELDEAMDEEEDARKGIESAQRSLRAAQESAAALNVTAPFAGKLIPDDEAGEPHISIGDELSSGLKLGVMVDDTVMRVPLYYSNAYIDRITEGMPATVSVAYTMTSVPATVEKVEKIERISPDGTKTFRVTLVFDNPGTLTKDMDAIGTILVDGESVVPADTGKLEYSREKDIVLESGGTVTSVSGLSYYRFSSGQSLLSMSNPDVTDALESARAGVESQQKMYEKKQERVAELEALIEGATVKAPMSGVVVDISVSEGEKVDGQRAICTVADLSSIVVNASIAEIDIDKVQTGQPVQLSMDDGSMFTGTVSSVSMQAESNESSGRGGGGAINFPIVITVDESPEATLSPNRSIEFKITTASSMDCVIVPSSAVVYTQEGAAVYAKEAEGVTLENAQPIPEGSEVPEGFVLVPVETGISDDTNTEILSGISEGVEVFLAAPKDAWEQYEQEMNGGEAAVAVG
ncbi:HlyD family efflux transporter periplasmic adaptor subunit [Butyricicoccus sp. 1XD8-22]|nr:HlyD family efflux transporter periplasmic adaptor subunit [Butyricicoccus sp. 1XD8-22]